MCIIKAFNYVITILHIQKEKKYEKPIVLLGDEVTHAQIFNERDKWRKTCIEQSTNYINEIKRLNAKLQKYQVPDLS